MNEKAEEIDDKKKEIENLKKELKDTNNDKQFMESFYPREQMMALNFLSTDQKVHYAISCVGKDLFVDIEKKFYEKYPKYKEKNHNFVVQGKTILRFKTIKENELESGIPIVMV